MGILQSKQKRREIVKSNNLIESSYKFTISEQRLVYLASSKLNVIMIDKNLSIEEVQERVKKACFELIEISVNEYKKDFNVKSNNVYEELSMAAKRLFERKITYMKDNGNVGQKRWVITCEYSDDRKSVFIQFHPDLIKDLMLFKNQYTIFQYDVTKQIKSNYACRVYELLKQYEVFGNRQFEIDDFRFKLGIGDEEYPRYSNLKQKVINAAITQINKSTDLYCELEEIKNRGKVETIKFKFIPQKVADNVTQQISLFEDEVAITITDKINMVERFSKLIGQTITPGQLDKIINVSAKAIEDNNLKVEIIDYIKEKKAVIDNYSKKKTINSYLGALITALENNWTLTKKQGDFNNFDQRTYDFDELEKKLLAWGN